MFVGNLFSYIFSGSNWTSGNFVANKWRNFQAKKNKKNKLGQRQGQTPFTSAF